MELPGVIIFVISYALISARRLGWLGFDRPAGALVGAVAVVVFGVLTPKEAIAAVDADTLLLLFGMMGLGAFLAIDGFFDVVAVRAVGVARTPTRLLTMLVIGAGALSALITNDAVCVLGAPLVVRLIQRHQLPALPFLLALATGANTGSVATLVGNPQNMLAASLGGLSSREHLLLVAPIAVMALAVNVAVLQLMFRRVLAAARLDAAGDISGGVFSSGGAVSVVVVLGTAVAAIAGAPLAWTATTGLVVLMLLHRRDSRGIWARIEWSVLLFFAALFIVVAGLVKSGAPAQLFEAVPLQGEGGLWRMATVFLLGSNIVSNVPFILVIQDQVQALPNPRQGWELVTVISTFAGNLTLLGSVANVIVAEAGRDVGGIGFVDSVKVGVPITVLSCIIGVCWIAAMS